VSVVFSEEGDVVVIGVTALEIFGLEVDMVRGCSRRPSYSSPDSSMHKSSRGS
jgi:predicted aspartyl protease